MKSNTETGGFGGGYTDARDTQPRCRTANVLYLGDSARKAPKKDARPKFQLRTGASNCSEQMTDDSLAHLPRPVRYCVYALLALTMSGVLPMFAAGLLIEFTEIVGIWVLFPMFAGVCWLFVRVAFR